MTIKAKWYSIRRKTALAAAVVGALAAAEILIYGDIGESWWDETVSAKSFIAEINALDVDQITVRINSIGGSVPDGLAIYNAIKRHKATVTTEVDGMAFSIASLIALAGDKRQMAANAMFMVHAPWTYMAGNSAELREAADMLDTWAAAMATSYAAATGRPQADMLALLTDGKDHYYTADEALAEKFIDGITDAQAPAAMGSAVRDMDVANRFRDVPAAWLQACGGKPAAAAAAAPSAAGAAQTQEPDMKIIRASLAASGALLLNAAGAGGSVTSGTGTGAPAATVVAAPAALSREQILAADRERQDSIAAAFKPHMAVAGTAELLASAQRDPAMTVEAAGFKLLAHLGASTQPVAGGGSIQTIEDERDKVRGAMTLAILSRASIALDKSGPVRADGTNPYRGRRMVDIAAACLAAGGVRVDGMRPVDIVGAAITQGTSDFPILLENVLHKTLQAGYVLQADTWTQFCARGSVSDFRAHNRYRTGSIGNYDSLGENGQVKNKALPDGEKESITATTKGNIINISREALINDDLGAFTGLATAFGRAGKRTIEAAVYSCLAENAGMGPTLSDNVTLFHATHNNVSTGAPTVTSFEAARVVMSAQKEPGSNDYLALSPAVWLGPDGISGQARVVNNSTFDPNEANKLQRHNIAYNMVSTIVGTPRLAGTPWYFFADPNTAPVIEVAFLDGVAEPYLAMEPGFDQLGIRWRALLDFGVDGVDYRGAVRSTGA